MPDELTPDKSRLYRTSSRRLSTPLIVTVVLLLAVILGGGYVFFQSQHPEEKVETPQPSPTPTSAPTETPTPTPSISPSGKVTPTGSTKTTPTAKPTVKPSGTTSTIDRGTVSVSVLNGSGTPGAASTVSDYLKGLGYNVVSTGNADSFDYTGLTVSVKSSKSAVLPQLKKDLAAQGTVGDTDTTFTGSSDVQVIVGK